MDCIFCKIAKKTIPADILFEDEQLIAFNDIRPQAPTHVLIIPKKHIPTLNDTVESDKNLLGIMILKAAEFAKTKGFSETGYRLVFNINSGGGQDVYHIHLHLLSGHQMTWPPG